MSGSAEDGWIDAAGLDRLAGYARASESVVVGSEDLLALIAMAREGREQVRCVECGETQIWHSARGECQRPGYVGRFTYPEARDR